MTNSDISELFTNNLSIRSSTITLVTSDHKQITANSKQLSAQSRILESMFTLPIGGSPEVIVEESKDVWELLLPYCGQERIAPFDLAGAHAWKLVKAFDKYKIGRGLDAVASAISLSRAQHIGSKARSSLVIDYFFKANFDKSNLDYVVKEIVNLGRAAVDEFEAAFKKFAEKEGASDGGKLLKLLNQRKTTLIAAREGELMSVMARNFTSNKRYFQGGVETVGPLIQLWNASADCTSPAQLETFLEGHSRETQGNGLLPWWELKDVLKALPTALSK